MIKMVAATNNKHKLIEIRRIFAPMEISILSLEDAGVSIEVEETADSFTGNARLKAEAVFERCGIPTLADDSGLCVDALHGEPGVYSARYGGSGLDDAGRTAALLERMKGIASQERSAKFCCAICCILSGSAILECCGECCGEIGFEPVGGSGFGYDPIFLVNGKSYSQLTGDEKDKISHRGRALENLRAMLGQYIGLLV